MQLSIIIVNYNVKLHLELCLLSVRKAISGIEAEVIVIDNNSTDGSKEYLPQVFKEVQFIFNNENFGFAKACNQGIKSSSGKYVLFLNPDTILMENSLKKGIDFFDSHFNTGAVGVRMTNEHGVFLKESKRGFPSPAASFFKLFGLAALFPGSKYFARYYAGHLKENENNPVDVLSGAFMMIRREEMELVGYFDETFFMYGEDIDLSYRIKKAGFQNYYLGEISITHFKGKSTENNLRHINIFYEAMTIFVKKHYEGKKSKAFILMIMAGISFRKMIAKTRLLFSH